MINNLVVILQCILPFFWCVLRFGGRKRAIIRTKMGKAPRAAKMPLRKGAWSPDEDQKLTAYINRFGIWNWNQIPNPAGLGRSGKSCRLRWMNYLRPDIKRGNFSKEEDETILKWHDMLGNRWSAIAAKLPGRTDNEIKNYWHSHLKKSIKNNFASKPEPHLVKASVVEVKRNELLRGVPEVSNLVGASGIQILPQQFPGDLSSSSTDLAVETHRNQTTEENFCSLKTFEELHSSCDLPFSFEDFRRNQKTEVTFDSLKKFEEFQSFREQPLSSEVLYGNQMMEENFVSAKPLEEFQSFWEQPLPLVDLCMVETDRGLMGPTTALLLQEPIYPFIS